MAVLSLGRPESSVITRATVMAPRVSMIKVSMAMFSIIMVSSIIFLSGCSRSTSNFKTDDPKKMTVEALYQEAKTQLNGRDWLEAIELYQTLETRFPYGSFTEQSQIELAYAYYKNGQAPLAQATLDRFLDLHPTHPAVDYAYYLKGLISYDEDSSWLGKLSGRTDLSDRDPDNAEKAVAAFSTLVERYPESRYANEAKRRLIYIGTALSRYELHVAQYYLQRQAYVAVVNRAKNIIESYDRTPTVEDALGIMATAYVEMDLQDLAEDTLRVLSHNFPNSPHLNRVRKDQPARHYQPVSGQWKGQSRRNEGESLFRRWLRGRSNKDTEAPTES